MDSRDEPNHCPQNARWDQSHPKALVHRAISTYLLVSRGHRRDYEDLYFTVNIRLCRMHTHAHASTHVDTHTSPIPQIIMERTGIRR